MSLDFMLLGEDGVPMRTVPLSVDIHYDLTIAARELGLDKIMLFEDYYEDAEVSSDDLHALAAQVATLRASSHSKELCQFVDKLESLIAEAESSGKSLHAIAD